MLLARLPARQLVLRVPAPMDPSVDASVPCHGCRMPWVPCFVPGGRGVCAHPCGCYTHEYVPDSTLLQLDPT